MFNQQTLIDELRHLDAETFEIEDISDLRMDAAQEGEIIDPGAEFSTSCSSCCSCSCSSCCSCSCSSCCSCSCSSCCS